MLTGFVAKGLPMITLQDCIALCGLSEEQVLAIAEHEHIPEIAAAALAQYLLCREHGAETIRDMLRNDLRAALARGDRAHARRLFMALRHFLSAHPECPARGRGRGCASRPPSQAAARSAPTVRTDRRPCRRSML